MMTSCPPLSFEFFPPGTEEATKNVSRTIADLASLRPSFVSVTYGAGGTTRERTRDLVLELQRSGAPPPMPHLTCAGHREGEILELLECYAGAGITRILALRGDAPSGGRVPEGDFASAADLIRCIRRFNDRGLHPVAGGFRIAAACFPEGHPATPNRLVEMDHLKAKVDAGVETLITQAFFDNHVFHDFRDRCDLAGVTVPILAGLLPLNSPQTMTRMAELAGNMRYPATLLRAVRRTAGDASGFEEVALHHATEQCRDLLDHDVSGLHFYTLNRSSGIRALLHRLGITG